MQISVVCTGKISLTQRLSKYTMSIGREVRDREEHQPANSEITRGSPHCACAKAEALPGKTSETLGLRRRRATLRRKWGVRGFCNLNKPCKKVAVAELRACASRSPWERIASQTRAAGLGAEQGQDGRGRADHPEDPHHWREWRGQVQVRRVCER